MAQEIRRVIDRLKVDRIDVICCISNKEIVLGSARGGDLDLDSGGCLDLDLRTEFETF